MKPVGKNFFFFWVYLIFMDLDSFKKKGCEDWIWMLVYTGSQCLEHISGYACILCLTKISYEKNLLLLKGFTCELKLVGHTANVQFQQCQLQANTWDRWAFSLQWMTVGSNNKPSANTEIAEEGTNLPEHKLALLSGQKSWFASLHTMPFHLPPFMFPGPCWHNQLKWVYPWLRSNGNSANSRLLAFAFCCPPLQVSTPQPVERGYQHHCCHTLQGVVKCCSTLQGGSKSSTGTQQGCGPTMVLACPGPAWEVPVSFLPPVPSHAWGTIPYVCVTVYVAMI